MRKYRIKEVYDVSDGMYWYHVQVKALGIWFTMPTYYATLDKALAFVKRKADKVTYPTKFYYPE